MSFMDPSNRERECGLTRLQLINLAKKQQWPMRRIYGRWYIGADEYKEFVIDNTCEKKAIADGFEKRPDLTPKR